MCAPGYQIFAHCILTGNFGQPAGMCMSVYLKLLKT